MLATLVTEALVLVGWSLWFVPTLVIAVQGLLTLRRAWQGRCGPATRPGRVAAGALVLTLGVWLNPLGHRLVATWQHERVLAAVKQRSGRPLSEVYAELGEPVLVGNGIPIYPSAWLTAFDPRYVRLVELEPGLLGTAYIDD